MSFLSPPGELLLRPRRPVHKAHCQECVYQPTQTEPVVAPPGHRCASDTHSGVGLHASQSWDTRLPWPPRQPALTGPSCVHVTHLVTCRLRPLDFESLPGALSDPEFFNYGVEAYAAYRKRSLSSDIADEQKKVQEADLVIFQFPLYWFSMPAILKGWVDRVLCQGFAFNFPECYDSGFLKDKRALLSITTGGTAEMFSKAGVSGDFRYVLWPLQHGTLHFCGFRVLAPQVSFAPEFAAEEERRRMLAAWARRLGAVWQEEPIQCTAPWYFGR